MPDFTPPDIRVLLGKVAKASPGDVKFMAQSLHDHAFEPRMPAEDVRGFMRDLGYKDIHAFCEKIGLPPHMAARWERFGVSAQMWQVLAYMAAQRKRLAEAVEEFEAATHVGLDEFLEEKGLYDGLVRQAPED